MRVIIKIVYISQNKEIRNISFSYLFLLIYLYIYDTT